MIHTSWVQVRAIAAAFATAIAVAGCTSDHRGAVPPARRSTEPATVEGRSLRGAKVHLTDIAHTDGHPTGLARRSGDDDATYVVLREGRVLRFAGNSAPSTLLDLRAQVRLDGEGGAFDLAFTTDGTQLLVSWGDSKNGDLVVSRIAVDERGRSGDATEVTRIGGGGAIHFGGGLEVTPDGDLLVSVGDGGELTDVAGRSRGADSLRGRILRYSGLGAANATTREAETVASGLRNPWRFATDPVTGRTWIGDVGQATWEEIDVIEPDEASPPDFGWDLVEGYDRARGLPPTDVRYPVAATRHADGRCAIVGGPIVRDRLLPDLVGALVVGDYCAPALTFLRFDGDGVVEQRQLALPDGATATAFATGPDHAMYVLRSDGVISRIDPGGDELDPSDAFASLAPPTFEGDRSVCGVSATIAAYPDMQGKPPEEVRVLASDLRAALDAYRAAPLPKDARAPFEQLDAGLTAYLDALESVGWDTDAPEVSFGDQFIADGAKAYLALTQAEAEICRAG